MYFSILILLVLACQLLHEAVGLVHVGLDLLGVQHYVSHLLVDCFQSLHELRGFAHALCERDVDLGDLELVLLGSEDLLAGVHQLHEQ